MVGGVNAEILYSAFSELIFISILYFQNELDKFDSLYLSTKIRSIKNEKVILEELDNKLAQLLEKYGLESAVNAYMKVYQWWVNIFSRFRKHLYSSGVFDFWIYFFCN